MRNDEKTVLVLGNDKISRRALAELPVERERLVVAIDCSTSITRVVRLIYRRRLSLLLVARMYWAEARRRSVDTAAGMDIIRSNADLVTLIGRHRPSRVLLFRAGLIINSAVLTTGVPIMNVHCARLPGFGGIGSIDRALKAGALDQCATLHQVTETIDGGRVVCTEPYILSASASYFENEERAYAAGRRLLRRVVMDPSLLASDVG